MEGDLEPGKEQQLAVDLPKALMRIHLSVVVASQTLGPLGVDPKVPSSAKRWCFLLQHWKEVFKLQSPA